jgi:hypothetical protein
LTSAESPEGYRRVIEQPCLVVDVLPLFLAHLRMSCADVFDIVFVEAREKTYSHAGDRAEDLDGR